MVSFRVNDQSDSYVSDNNIRLTQFINQQTKLVEDIKGSYLSASSEVEKIKTQIINLRNQMKGIDIWLRYLDPGKPYKCDWAGLTLAQLLKLIETSLCSIET